MARRLAGSARDLVRLVLLALAAWSFWSATSAIRTHVEFGGHRAQDSTGSRPGSGREDLLVVESRNASDVHVLALPLAYIYGQACAAAEHAEARRAAVRANSSDGRASGIATVYFLGGGGTDLLSRDGRGGSRRSERFQVPEYESLRNAYPTHVRRKEFDFGIYRFVDPVPRTEGLALDVGTMDDLHVVRFHAKERDRRGTFRWTRAQSYLSLAGVDDARRELVIWMDNGGPAAAGGAGQHRGLLRRRRRWARSSSAGRPEPTSSTFRRRSPRGGRGHVGAVTVRLISSTFGTLERSRASDDDRELGVMVDRVEVRRVAAAR